MKNIKSLIFVSTLFLGGLAFTACTSSDAESTEQLVQNEVYYCPMECEGDKTYDEVGTCPVCGMDLVILENNSEE